MLRKINWIERNFLLWNSLWEIVINLTPNYDTEKCCHISTLTMNIDHWVTIIMIFINATLDVLPSWCCYYARIFMGKSVLCWIYYKKLITYSLKSNLAIFIFYMSHKYPRFNTRSFLSPKRLKRLDWFYCVCELLNKSCGAEWKFKCAWSIDFT